MLSTTTTSSRPPRDLDDVQKRRKIAKLERFLGENIPPELVFPSSTPLQRSTSVMDSRSRGKASHKSSRSLPMPSSPKTPTPLSAVPSTVAAAPTTPQSQSTEELGTSVEQQSPTRRQSMTSMPSPTMATTATQSTRGASFDGPTSPPFQKMAVELETTTPGDPRKYRKEGKGWSGEWNVKDMELVANALRGLKVR